MTRIVEQLRTAWRHWRIDRAARRKARRRALTRAKVQGILAAAQLSHRPAQYATLIRAIPGVTLVEIGRPGLTNRRYAIRVTYDDKTHHTARHYCPREAWVDALQAAAARAMDEADNPNGDRR